MNKTKENIEKAAEAAGISVEKFISGVRGILSPSRCRDTKPIFSDKVLQALSIA